MAQTAIPTWMAEEVLNRDNWICLACAIPVRRYPGAVRPDSASIDHVIPDTAEYRGATHPDNLQTLCVSCNSRKGSTIRDYRHRWLSDADTERLLDEAAAWHKEGDMMAIEVKIGDDWPGGFWVAIGSPGHGDVLVDGPYPLREQSLAAAHALLQYMSQGELKLHSFTLWGNVLRATVSGFVAPRVAA